jgi:hypothetical protein
VPRAELAAPGGWFPIDEALSHEGHQGGRDGVMSLQLLEKQPRIKGNQL